MVFFIQKSSGTGFESSLQSFYLCGFPLKAGKILLLLPHLPRLPEKAAWHQTKTSPSPGPEDGIRSGLNSPRHGISTCFYLPPARWAAGIKSLFQTIYCRYAPLQLPFGWRPLATGPLPFHNLHPIFVWKLHFILLSRAIFHKRVFHIFHIVLYQRYCGFFETSLEFL